MTRNYIFEGLEPEILLDSKPTPNLLKELEKTTDSISPIFVVGCPRSGTTLLANVLGGNKKLACADESLFLLDIWNMYYRLVLASNRRKSSYLASYTSKQRNLDYISQYVNKIYIDLVNSKPGGITAIEHTPVYSHLFHFLELIFHNPIYLHIVRDENNVIKSLENVRANGGIWGQSDTISRREFTRYWVNDARDIKKHVPDRYFEIQYENFVDNPKNTLSEFMKINDISWTAKMESNMKIKYAQ